MGRTASIIAPLAVPPLSRWGSTRLVFGVFAAAFALAAAAAFALPEWRGRTLAEWALVRPRAHDPHPVGTIRDARAVRKTRS